MLQLGDLIQILTDPSFKDSIDRFNTFYNESKYGPNCTFTKKSYILLDNDKRLDQIVGIIKEIAQNA